MDTPTVRSEKIRQPFSGYFMLVVFLVLLAFLIVVGSQAKPDETGWVIGMAVVLLVVAKGLLVITPNTAKLLLLFGAYRGSIRKSGLCWVNPFYQRMTFSLRARNFESEKVKVNDKMGNPILISVILVWKVRDTYKAFFEVDDYVNFIKIQTDSAVRQLAASYPYDHFEDERATVTLSTDFNEVNSTLEKEVTDRLFLAGIEVVEARITYLAYAPEIAHSMLKRQQASAVVSNLMVVLCGDREYQPVVNTGTLNH